MDTKLKKMRKKAGLTQAEVARTAKVNVRVYQKYEAGECLPNVLTAILIAKTLNSTVEECFSDINNIKK